MPGQRSPNVIQVNLRLTKDLRKRLMAAAEDGGRSLNEEMVTRLKSTFRRERADKILDNAQKLLDKAGRMIQQSEEDKREIEKDLRAGLTVDDIFPRNALRPRGMKK